jgi:molybdopterin converting factor small subunit
MDNEELIGLLLNTTKEQQQAVSDLIQEFKRQQTRLDDMASSLPNDLQAAIMMTLRANREDAALAAKNAVETAINPIVSSLSNTVAQASDEKRQLNRAVRLLSWKWLLIASATTASVAGVLLFAVYSAVWWQRSELEGLRTEKAAMEDNIEQLSKRKGDVHFSLCGKQQRPCVEVERDRAYGDDDKHLFYILKGVK